MYPEELYQGSNPLIWKEENVLRYKKGGYHPISLGDTFKDGRYEIKHKLSHGGFSTVWVARDRVLQRLVALKILTADESIRSREFYSLEALSQKSKARIHSHNIAQLLDSFFHTGANGCHQCLVFEFCGPSVDLIVSDAHEFGERLDLGHVLLMSIQLLEATSLLHEIGYAHGDLSARNLCCASSCLSGLPDHQLEEVLGPLNCEKLVRNDGEAVGEGVPDYLVQSASWDGWPCDEDKDDENVRVIDLGHAFPIDDPPACLPQPFELRAPETIFTTTVNFHHDLWRAGLIIYYLTFGDIPFGGSTITGLVSSMICFLGDIPPEWRSQWEQKTPASENPCDNIKAAPPTRPELDQLISDQNLDKETRELLLVVRNLMKYLPENRMSVSEALEAVRGIYQRVQSSSESE